MRFKILTSAITEFRVFGNVTPWCLVQRHQRCNGPSRRHLHSERR